MPRRTARKSKKLKKSRKSKTENWRLFFLKKKKTKLRKKVIISYISVFLIVSISISMLYGIALVRNILKPFASADSGSSFNLKSSDNFSLLVSQVDSYDGDSLNVLKTSLLIFDINNTKVHVIDIDTETNIEVVGKFGDEPISKVLRLSYLSENNDFNRASQLYIKSMQNYLKYPINKYVFFDSQINENLLNYLTGSVDNLNLNSKVFSNFKSSTRSDISLNEMFFIYKFINGLTSDRWNYIKLVNDSKSLLNLYKNFEDLNLDSNLALEKKNISVLNGSRVTGMAEFNSRVIKNLGGKVVVVGNATQIHEKSLLIVDDLNSSTVKRLLTYYNGIEVVRKADLTEYSDPEIDRSDIILIIGVDRATGL